MAGNIIPAIATTNAVIAGLIVLEGLKILSGKIDQCRTVSVSIAIFKIKTITFGLKQWKSNCSSYLVSCMFNKLLELQKGKHICFSYFCLKWKQKLVCF